MALKKYFLLFSLLGQQCLQAQSSGSFQSVQKDYGLKEKTIFSFNFFDKMKTKRWMHDFRNVFLENQPETPIEFNGWEAYYNITQRQKELPYCNELRARFRKQETAGTQGNEISNGSLFVTVNDMRTLTTPHRTGNQYFALMPVAYKTELINNIRVSYYLPDEDSTGNGSSKFIIAMEDMSNPLFAKVRRREYLEALRTELQTAKKALPPIKKDINPDSLDAGEREEAAINKWKSDSLDYKLGIVDSIMKVYNGVDFNKPAMIIPNAAVDSIFSDGESDAMLLVKLAVPAKQSKRTDPRFITILLANQKMQAADSVSAEHNFAALPIAGITRLISKPNSKENNKDGKNPESEVSFNATLTDSATNKRSNQ